jgi:hypothetical protein
MTDGAGLGSSLGYTLQSSRGLAIDSNMQTNARAVRLLFGKVE